MLAASVFSLRLRVFTGTAGSAPGRSLPALPRSPTGTPGVSPAADHAGDSPARSCRCRVARPCCCRHLPRRPSAASSAASRRHPGRPQHRRHSRARSGQPAHARRTADPASPRSRGQRAATGSRRHPSGCHRHREHPADRRRRSHRQEPCRPRHHRRTRRHPTDRQCAHRRHNRRVGDDTVATFGSDPSNRGTIVDPAGIPANPVPPPGASGTDPEPAELAPPAPSVPPAPASCAPPCWSAPACWPPGSVAAGSAPVGRPGELGTEGVLPGAFVVGAAFPPPGPSHFSCAASVVRNDPATPNLSASPIIASPAACNGTLAFFAQPLSKFAGLCRTWCDVLQVSTNLLSASTCVSTVEAVVLDLPRQRVEHTRHRNHAVVRPRERGFGHRPVLLEHLLGVGGCPSPAAESG